MTRSFRFNLWQRLLAGRAKNIKSRRKPRRIPLDFDVLEVRFCPSAAMGNDFVQRPYDDLADADQLLFMPSQPKASVPTPPAFKPTVGTGEGASPPSGPANAPPSSSANGGFNPPTFAPPDSENPPNPNTPSAPNATGLPQVSSKAAPTVAHTVQVAASSPGGATGKTTLISMTSDNSSTSTTTASSSSATSGTHHKAALPGVVTAAATLNVVDDNNGIVLSPSVPETDFSTYSVQLDAELVMNSSGSFGTPSYTWNLTSAADASSVSGASSYRLSFTWASFSGAARTDTVVISVTDGTNNISETIVFDVQSTSSPGYTATQPTTTATWSGVLPPDAVSSQQPTVGMGPYYQLGQYQANLLLTIPMPAYNPNGPAQELLYNSTAANPQPIFTVQYQLNPSDAVPTSLSAILTFNGTAASPISVDPTLMFPGDTLQIGLQANATALSTGRYSYSFQVVDADASPMTTTYSGSVDVINYGSSAFGGGWSLAGVERIYSVTGGAILDLGDGTSLWFANGGVGGTFVTPAGDYSTLTQNTSTSVYTRAMPDGTQYHFNSSGLETAVVDRNSNATTYMYSGSKLTSIKDFNNQLVTLAYSGSNVTSVTDPALRTTTLAYSSGLLTSVKDADGSLWTYGYDATTNQLTTLTDPDQGTVTFAYDGAARVSTVTTPTDASEGFVIPAQEQGLVVETGSADGPGVGTPATLVALAPTEFENSLSNQSNTLFNWLGFGEPTETVDPLGDTSVTHNNASGQPWLNTDALGNSQRNFFDSNGNVTEQVQANSATTQYTYNSFSETSQTTDANGNLTTASYNASGNMTQMENAQGAFTTYTYTSVGLVSSVKDSLGNLSTYSYNSLNELTQVQNAQGNLTTSLYNSAGNMTTSIDAKGDRTTYSYNSLGEQTQTQDAQGNLTTSLYDSAGNMTTSIDAKGDRTTYSYNSNNQQTQVKDALGDLSTSLYDSNGNLTTSIDARGDRTTYSYNSLNQQTQVKDALGDLTTSLFDANRNLTTSIDARGDRTTYSFNSLNQQTQAQDALGDLTTSLFDANGNMTTSIDSRGDRTTYSFNSLNQQTQVKDALGDLTTSLFDANSNMTTSIDARGDRTTYSFNSLNQQTQVKDALGDLSTSLFDANGNMTTSIDARGERTTYNFNSLNQQTQVEDPLTDLTTSLFDANGNMTTSIDARGDRTTYSYNSLNQQTQVEDALTDLTTSLYDANRNQTTSINALGARTTYAFDALNRETAVTDANNHTVTTLYDSAGNVTTSIDASGARTTHSFDVLNRQTTVKDADTGLSTTVYDKAGNVTNTIDQMGDKTTYVFDAINRQTTVIDPRGGYTTTVFDANSNTINVIDPDNNKTTFAYDALNRETQETNPLGGTETMAYDAASRETSATDFDGRVINYSYDSLNRETGETWILGGSTVNTLTFTFDANGNLLTAANSAGTNTMAYDKLDRMTSIQEPFGLALTYAYDAAGNETTTQDSFGGTQTSVYDPVGNLTTREFGGTSQTPLREDLAYTARNQISTEWRYSNLAGTTLVASSVDYYNSVGMVTNIQHFGDIGSSLANYTYTYDLASRLTSEQDNGTNTTYSYDADSELTDAGGTLYSYDLNGNRTMTGYTTGTDNELTNDGTWTYTYDAEGNMTEKSKGPSAETWYYTYDNKNQMTGAKQEATAGGTLESQATYVYDAQENRLEEDVWTSGGGLTVTRFGYNGQNVWVDLNSSNQLQMRRLYLNGVDQVFARIDSSGNAAWYLTDHLGSIREVINSANTTTDIVTYDAFGNINSESNSSFGDRYKYTGREFDSVTGLQYNRARYYYAPIGRWAEQDLRGFQAGDHNLYRYVGNSPTFFLDPLGAASIGAPPPPPPQPLALKVVIPAGFNPIPKALNPNVGIAGTFAVPADFVVTPSAPQAGIIVQKLHVAINWPFPQGRSITTQQDIWEFWNIAAGQSNATPKSTCPVNDNANAKNLIPPFQGSYNDWYFGTFPATNCPGNVGTSIAGTWTNTASVWYVPGALPPNLTTTVVTVGGSNVTVAFGKTGDNDAILNAFVKTATLGPVPHDLTVSWDVTGASKIVNSNPPIP